MGAYCMCMNNNMNDTQNPLNDPDPALRAFAKLTDEERDVMVEIILVDLREECLERNQDDRAEEVLNTLQLYKGEMG